MKLSIIIPARDDEALLRDVVESVRSVPFRFLALEPEIIVVDDGSSDGTSREIASLGGAIDRVRRHATPRGIGAALRTGLEAATGEIVAIHHCDLRYDPNELLALVRRLLDGSADAVYGRRMRAGEPVTADATKPTLWGRLASLVTRLAGDFHAGDPHSGQKVFRRWSLERLELREDGWGVDAELTLKLQQHGWELQEMDVHFEDVEDERGLVPERGDDLACLRAAVRYGWVSRDLFATRQADDALRVKAEWSARPRMRMVPPEFCAA